ncbi:MAG: mce [Dehalococcoidia bacterium]|nr:mce [Dehalococcoidia bacterium]
MFKGIRNILVAVTDLEEAIKKYQDVFGLEQTTPIRDTRWGFRNAMMGCNGQNFIELAQPSDEKSALARFMKERSNPLNPGGEGLYLIAIEVDDLGKAVDQVKKGGGRVSQDAESPNAAWVHPLSSHYAFFELQGPRS